MIHKKKSHIYGLFLTLGEWCTNEDQLQTATVDFFKHIIRKSNGNIDPVIAPSLPRFPSEATFYKTYWHIIGEKVVQVVQEAFMHGSFDPSLSNILITLIPKVEDPKRLMEFRPISLCNIIHKLISRVLVNRLRLWLQNIVIPLQSSFILGRSTSDNAIILVNPTKSRAFASGGIPPSRQRKLSLISSIGFLDDLGPYLRFWFPVGRITKNMFSHVINKVRVRLASWKGRFLNRAGHVTIANSVLASLPSYTMQVQWLP
uniref:Transposon TX1 uncharacterized n=1 Tax=Cajanus cajan TaxID=3821 RepID=A0A151SJJ9_CAJCA|nr:Transposon TX1 uncharacterized [Cajanus cajan]